MPTLSSTSSMINSNPMKATTDLKLTKKSSSRDRNTLPSFGFNKNNSLHGASDHTSATVSSDIESILDDAERILAAPVGAEIPALDLSDEETSKLTVEALLTRQLGIRFIDARALATEAKLEFDVKGYPSQEMKLKIVEYAVNKFQNEMPQEQQATLRRVSSSLNTAKDECRRSISSASSLSSSSHHRRRSSSNSTTASQQQQQRQPMKRLSLLGMKLQG